MFHGRTQVPLKKLFKSRRHSSAEDPSVLSPDMPVTTVWNSSLRGSDILFCLFGHQVHTWCPDMHAGQNTPTQKSRLGQKTHHKLENQDGNGEQMVTAAKAGNYFIACLFSLGSSHCQGLKTPERKKKEDKREDSKCVCVCTDACMLGPEEDILGCCSSGS